MLQLLEPYNLILHYMACLSNFQSRKWLYNCKYLSVHSSVSLKAKPLKLNHTYHTTNLNITFTTTLTTTFTNSFITTLTTIIYTIIYISSKPLNSLKSSSFNHPSSLFIHSSFILHPSSTFKLFSLFSCILKYWILTPGSEISLYFFSGTPFRSWTLWTDIVTI